MYKCTKEWFLKRVLRLHSYTLNLYPLEVLSKFRLLYSLYFHFTALPIKIDA